MSGTRSSLRRGGHVALVFVFCVFLITSPVAGVISIPSVDSQQSTFTTSQLTSTDATTITDCTVIESSGYYVLGSNITQDFVDQCIHINSSDVVLDGQGHTIDGVTVDNTDAGIRTNQANVTIRNLRTTNSDYGISFGGSNGSIVNVTAVGNEDNGIYLSGENVTVKRSTFRGSASGLSVLGATNPTIINNQISNVESGLRVWADASGTRIQSTAISDSEIGIEIHHYTDDIPSDTVVENTTITDTQTGVQLWSRDGTIPARNTSLRNTTIEGSTDTVITTEHGAIISFETIHIENATESSTIASGQAANVEVRTTLPEETPALPADYQRTSGTLNGTTTTGTGYLNITLTPTGSTDSQQEYSVWQTDSGDWTQASNTIRGDSASANITTPATFTLLSQPTDDDSGDSGSEQVDVDPSVLAGSGTADDPYVITNASELQAMEDDLDANYTLVSDIDASNTSEWNSGSGFAPVGGSSRISSTPPPFTGSLDGNNHTVTGLTINRSDKRYVGLFGESEGTVSNLSLTNLTITGSDFVGGLVGRNYEGNITSATASGSVNGSEAVGGLVGGNNGGNVTSTRASGSVTGEVAVGGLVGGNGGNITSATASSSVTGEVGVGGLIGGNGGGAVRNATASGSVTGSTGVGGLVGGNVFVVSDSVLTGTIRDTFAVGPVSGDSEVGGVVGNNTVAGSTGTVTNSYWDEQATRQPTSAGNATGLTTAQMTGEAARTNMDELDFEGTWAITESYPELRALAQDNQNDPQPSPDRAVASLQPRDLTFTPNETTTVSLVVNGTETIGAYNFNLTVEGASSVQIEEVSLNGGPGIEDVGIGADGREASADAALAEIESSADSAATLGTVTISGIDAGNATLSAEINTLGDTQGSPYTIADPEATASVTVANQTGPGDLTGNGNPATDPDGDGVFEDVNGDGGVDVLDVQALFTTLGSESVEGNSALDVNGDGSVDVLDVQALFTQL